MYKFKKMVSSPGSEIIKASIIMYIIWYFLDSDKFDWWNNIFIAFAFLICAWILIVISSILSFNRKQQPSITIPNELIERVNDTLRKYYIVEGKQGLHTQNNEEYILVKNPENLYFKLKAMQEMLYSVGIMKTDEAADKMEPYIKQLENMIGKIKNTYY